MKLKKESKYLNEMIKEIESKLAYLMTRGYGTDLHFYQKEGDRIVDLYCHQGVSYEIRDGKWIETNYKLPAIKKFENCLVTIKEIESSYQIGELTRQEAEEMATEALAKTLKGRTAE